MNCHSLDRIARARWWIVRVYIPVKRHSYLKNKKLPNKQKDCWQKVKHEFRSITTTTLFYSFFENFFRKVQITFQPFWTETLMAFKYLGLRTNRKVCLTKGLMVVCRNVYRQRDMVHSQNRSRLVTWICKALTLLSGDVLGVSEKHFIVH